MDKNTETPDGQLTGLEFTWHAKKSIEKAVRDPYFRDRDPELMLQALMNEIRMISFGDYLKRYIRKKTAEHHPRNGAETADELEILCEAFKKNEVPPSFSPTTAKIRALAKNWLTQRVVNRNVVFLLGFALEMPPEDVNEFLTKALKESRIDPKDPFEVICWYCYRNRLPYASFEKLRSRFFSGEPGAEEEMLLNLDSTVRVRMEMESIRTEKQLTGYLSRLSLVNASGRQSIAARRQFDILYRQACSAAADMKTEMEREDAEIRAVRLSEEISRNDRYYDFQKKRMVQKEREAYRVYRAEDMTAADLENILYSAVPKDRNGNLIPMKESLLNIHFAGKRLNRQHISEILDGRGMINRFDIITLCFFVTAREAEARESTRERYSLFVSKANRYLKDSDMTPLYAANPYESFVLMCMLTDDPLGSFSDVWELSFETE